jgi:protein-disulfide isomerase
MTATAQRRTPSPLVALLLAMLAFALGSCTETASEDGVPAGEPIAKVAAPASSSWKDTVVKTKDGGYLVGNPDAALKLVEYGSLTCPACAAFSAEASEPLMNDYINSGRVSFEFRSFIIHGPLDLALTRMIGCTAPEAAVPLADQVWANLPAIQQRAIAAQAQLESLGSLPEDQRFVAFGEYTGLYEFFGSRGVSEDQARTCLGDFESLKQIEALSKGYSKNGINSTPTFVLNGQVLDINTWSKLEPALQRAGARDK